jgi:hypothetical protein
MKTAMQELDEWLTNKWSDPSKLIPCSEVSDMIDRLIKKEKEQIINAQMNVLGGGNDPRWKELHGKIAEQYYNETFKTDKE